MSWVSRTTAPEHTCEPPMRQRLVTIPSASMTPGVQTKPLMMPPEPDGLRDDLWRCDDCGQLWRIGDPDLMVGGYAAGGPVWRPATLWQRLRHRAKKETAA